MNTPNDGGPIAASINRLEDGSLVSVGGISIRDWFAGMALQGLFASGKFTYDDDEQSGNHNDFSRRKTYSDDGDKLKWENSAIGMAWDAADDMMTARAGKESV